MRETIENILLADGFLVSTATNRGEAVDRVRNEAIDLVLMNMLMPRAEGIGTLIAVRSFDPAMRIVAMSCDKHDSGCHFLPLAESLGAAALLSDPLDATKLIDCVRGLLGRGALAVA
jgi:DNA-binding NtrC family response regulator